MSNMTYIEKLNAFDRWLETNYLPAQSQLLWYKLISLFNKCGWAEWVTIDNQRLMSLIQIRREATFIEVRNNLVENNLLEYQKGKKGSPNKYKMLFCTFTGEVKTVVNTVVQTEVNTVAQTVDINRVRLDKDYTPISPNGFDLFWKAYPRKVAKASALKSWNKIKPSENLVADILKSLSEQIKSDGWQKDNGKYIPHPATWLNGNRWEDETETTVQAEEIITSDMIALPVQSKTRTLEELENLSLEELL